MATVPNGTGAASSAPKISASGSGLPSRVILHGVEGCGKTTFASFAPKPIVAMTGGETGLLTLIDNGRVPETPHFDQFETWPSLLEAIRWLTVNDHPYRTFVIDTLNGAERLCFDYVCKRFFNNEPESFLAYGKGPEIAQKEWITLFAALDKLRAAKRMAMILLCHTRIKAFRNPDGDDYDRYCPEMHEKCWGPAAKWADIVLFANFETFAKKERGAMKAKGVGGNSRMLYTQRTAAYDAKNRIGLPAEISMGSKPADSWTNFVAAVRAARKPPTMGGGGGGGAVQTPSQSVREPIRASVVPTTTQTVEDADAVANEQRESEESQSVEGEVSEGQATAEAAAATKEGQE